MVKDKDRERLSDALAANVILLKIAESVRRRGITQADYTQLASLKHRVTSLQIETTAKLAEIAPDGVAKMGRNKRLEMLESLYTKERLEYWLAVQVQADLARTRCDLLTLLWEHHSHLRLLRPSTRTSPTRSGRGSFARRPKSPMRSAPCQTRRRRPGSIPCA